MTWDVTARPWPAATWSLVETFVVFFVPFGLVLYLDVIVAGILGLRNGPLTSLLLTGGQEAFMFFGVLWWMRATGNGGIERMGLRRGQFSAGDVGVGVGMGIVLLVTSVIITLITRSIVISVTGHTPRSSSNFDRYLPGNWIYVGAVMAVLVAPIAEEFLFRGFLFQGLRRRWSFWPAALVSATLFAILHQQAIRLPELIVAGVILAWVYESRRTLTASILTHFTLNLIAVGITIASR
jgi:membrane protease YdiL (CAAX protease family)